MTDDFMDIAEQTFGDCDYDPERTTRMVRAPRFHVCFAAPEHREYLRRLWMMWRPVRHCRGWAPKVHVLEQARQQGLISQYGMTFALGWVKARPRDARLPPSAFHNREFSVSLDADRIVLTVPPFLEFSLPPFVAELPTSALERLVVFQRIVWPRGLSPIQLPLVRLDFATGKTLVPTATDADLKERARLAFAISAGLPISERWRVIGARAPLRLARLIARAHPEDLGVPGPWTPEVLAAFLVVSGIAPPADAGRIAEQILSTEATS